MLLEFVWSNINYRLLVCKRTVDITNYVVCIFSATNHNLESSRSVDIIKELQPEYCTLVLTILGLLQDEIVEPMGFLIVSMDNSSDFNT